MIAQIVLLQPSREACKMRLVTTHDKFSDELLPMRKLPTQPSCGRDAGKAE